MRRCLIILITIIALVSCEVKDYKTGTGEYSLTRADFVLAHSFAPSVIDYVLTDDGDSLPLNPMMQVAGITAENKFFRVLLYYDRYDEGGKHYAIGKNIFAVSLLPIHSLNNIDTLATDPLVSESCWLSKNHHFVNLGLFLKTGVVNGETKNQRLEVCMLDKKTLDSGRRVAFLQLLHGQNDAPEYYSVRRYVSIPIDTLQADSIVLTVNTYKGEMKYALSL